MECDSLRLWKWMNNSGVVRVKGNARVTNSGGIINYSNIIIEGDLIIAQGSYLYNSCSVQINGDLTNYGTIAGSASPGQGKITVAGGSYNYGGFCDSTYCDMCDAGMPANGFDLAGGTIGPAPYVTYCDSSIQPSCDSVYVLACVPLPPDTVIDPVDTTAPVTAPAPELSAYIYPNPASSTAVFHYSVPEEKQMFVTVHDAVGREVFASRQKCEKGDNLIEINVSSLSSGMYFVSFRIGTTVQVKKLIVSNKEE